MQAPETFPRLRDAILKVLDQDVKVFTEELCRGPYRQVDAGAAAPIGKEAIEEADALFAPAEIALEVLAGRDPVEGLDERLESVRSLDAWLRSLANANMKHWFHIFVERRIGTGYVGPGFEHGGVRYEFHDYRVRPIFLVAGESSLRAAYYRREGGGEGIFPIDLVLGLDRSGCTREAAFMMAHFSSESDYPQAEELICRATGVTIDQNRLHRRMEALGETAQSLQESPPSPPESQPSPSRLVIETDGVMVPMRYDPEGNDPELAKEGYHEAHSGVVAVPGPAEHAEPKYHRKDRSPDRPSRTKADTHRDIQLRESTCVATYEGRKGHLRKLKAEAERRGWTVETETAILGDGSPWIHKDTRKLFPGAIHILDWHHAMEHLADVRNLVYKPGSPDGEAWLARHESNLWDGKPEPVISSIYFLARTSSKSVAKKLRTEARFFRKRVKMMDYPSYRAAGWPIGSGAVESFCRHGIQERCKCSGMRWSPQGIRNILAVRTTILNARFNELWSAHASRAALKEAV
jgi:hypothetical protein